MWWDDRLRLTFLTVPGIFSAQAPAQADGKPKILAVFGGADGAFLPDNGSVSGTEGLWSGSKPETGPQQNGQPARLRATIDLDCPYVRCVL